MVVQVVLVHGIRTSASMWRPQLEYLAARGNPAVAVDLPGHGRRRGEMFTLDEALATIDRAVTDAAGRGPVLLVGHSMGGLVSIEYAGRIDPPPVAAFVAVSATTIPRGMALRTYRMLAGGLDALPRNGQWLTELVLRTTLPLETRGDFGAGGYAYLAQDTALRSLSTLDLLAALRRIRVPMWFVNGQWDQLRLNEKLFTTVKPDAELIVIPRSTHLVTAMRPEAFDAVLNLALATVEAGMAESTDRAAASAGAGGPTERAGSADAGGPTERAGSADSADADADVAGRAADRVDAGAGTAGNTNPSQAGDAGADVAGGAADRADAGAGRAGYADPSDAGAAGPDVAGGADWAGSAEPADAGAAGADVAGGADW